MLYDETTGLYNARARWYQPDVGRFMTEDPAGLSGGLNQYTFAGDDPINASDPSGAPATDGDGSVCSINAESCGDPLQLPGSSSYNSGTYGGGVSFAGGFGSISPGVSVGSAVINLSGQPLYCWASECARLSVVLTLTADGKVDIYQLYNQITSGDGVLRSFIDDGQSLTPNDPSNGFWISFTDWRWVQVAGVASISRVANAVFQLAQQWNGRPYQLGDSNIFVNQILSSAGITLTSQQQRQLGWRPTFNSLPREP